VYSAHESRELRSGKKKPRLFALPLCLLALASASISAQSPSPESSSTDKVQPVLEHRCGSCHLQKQKGGLSFRSLDTMLKGGDSGPALDLEHPEKSLILNAIHYNDPDLQMPPSGKLPDDEIALIEKWIRRGAQMPSNVLAAQPEAKQVDKAALIPAKYKSPQFTAAQEQYFEAKVRPLLINRCFGCHADSASGGLRLDSRDAALKGGKDGVVIVAGQPEKSLLVSAVHYQNPSLKMPPSSPMNSEEVGILEQWIRDGAPWPEKAETGIGDNTWWAFQKPKPQPVPQINSKWASSDIDRFVLAQLNEKHLQPVADADKRTLIRRVTYDLTGLPPTPQETAAFLADKSKDAYTRVVDRLLASSAYGERWGRLWLDVVRYSDTSGNGPDYPTPEAYKYRNYVIDAFNRDLPYDEFIREQIAGDLLPSTSEPDHWRKTIATGYLAIARRGSDDEDKTLVYSDAVDNLGYTYLGVTVACARCHDHKFDPIPTRDYYALYGILASTHLPHPGSESIRYPMGLVYRDPKAADSPELKSFQEQLKPIADTIEAAHKLPYFDDILPALEARRMELFKQVRRGFLQALGGGPLPQSIQDSGRLELANWIASPANPLTARVMVNRIWQGLFGRGIVATPNDYGKRGIAPSNPQLLDYLALEFIRNGWSIKAMQRTILLSRTYRLSSTNSVADAQVDPEDIYLWKHSRKRLDAEEIRDSLLATSGTLDSSPGGEHPFPALAEWNWSQHRPFNAVYETNKRTVYVMVQRSKRHPYLGIFDGPDPNGSTATRATSVSPLQALYFMNAGFPKTCATHLADSLPQRGATERAEIASAFQIVFNRNPDAEEIARSSEFLRKASGMYTAHGDSADTADKKALTKWIEVLYSSNEFMFLD
jgi:mono/diheme cytochrome c family protein